MKENRFLEVWTFARTRNRMWLLPILVGLLTLGFLLFLLEGSALSPIVYSFF